MYHVQQRTLQTPPAPEENGSPSYSSLQMWAQQADAWTYSADLPQHVKSAALLAGAHTALKTKLWGTPDDLWNKLPTLSSTTEWESDWSWPNAEEEEECSATDPGAPAPCYLQNKIRNWLWNFGKNWNWLWIFYVPFLKSWICLCLWFVGFLLDLSITGWLVEEISLFHTEINLSLQFYTK
jgi:hypothetical protein